MRAVVLTAVAAAAVVAAVALGLAARPLQWRGADCGSVLVPEKVPAREFNEYSCDDVRYHRRNQALAIAVAGAPAAAVVAGTGALAAVALRRAGQDRA